jgi:hypothetical protein
VEEFLRGGVSELSWRSFFVVSFATKQCENRAALHGDVGFGAPVEAAFRRLETTRNPLEKIEEGRMIKLL